MAVIKNNKTGLFELKGKYKTIKDGKFVYKDYWKHTGQQGFKLKKEAVRADILLRNRSNGKSIVTSMNYTVKEALSIFLSECKGQMKGSSYYTSVKAYKKVLSLYKDIPVKDINPHHLQLVFNGMDSDGNSLNYIDKCYYQCTKFWRWLTANEYVEENIMLKVKMIKHPDELNSCKKENYFTYEEFQEFIKNVQEDEDIFYYTFFSLLYYGGLRKGEALALKYEDVNFRNKTIKVNKTLSMMSTRDNPIITPPKTSESNRIVSIPDILLEILLKWKQKNEIKYGFDESWYVFTDGIQIVSLTTLGRKWHYYLDYADGYIDGKELAFIPQNSMFINVDTTIYQDKNLEIFKRQYKGKLKVVSHDKKSIYVASPYEKMTIHGLRSSAVSFMVNNMSRNINYQTLAKHFGHTVEIMLKVYSHAFPEEERKIGNELNRIISLMENENSSSV